LKAANNLNPNFKEFLSLLIEEKAEFLLVGGYAAADFYGLRIPMISKEHLIRNKKATGRTQDLLDLENLE
jgi:hypothetical protein